MRSLLQSFALAAFALMPAAAHAVSVSFTEYSSGLSAGYKGYTLSIDPGAEQGGYNTIDVLVTPLIPGTLSGALSPAFKVPLGAGDATAFSGTLIAASLFGVGQTSTGDEFSGAYASFGTNNISLVPRDFADIVVTSGGTGFSYRVRAIGAGSVIESLEGEVSTTSTIPLPGGAPLILSALAGAGLLRIVRRR